VGRSLPPLNAIRSFEAAARTGGITTAADELSVTPGAVSHQIRVLEDRLGSRLVERRGNRFRLTPAGERLLPDLTAALDRISRSTERLRHDHSPEGLTVQVMPTFGERWLVPRLPDWRLTNPDTELTVKSTWVADRFLPGADAAIWYGEGNWPGIAARRLFTEALVPVAAPALAAVVRERGYARALYHLPLLRVSSSPDPWNAWMRHARIDAAACPWGPVFDTCGLAIEAAVEGIGVALANRPFVERQIDRGELVELWPAPMTSEAGWYLCLPGGSPSPSSTGDIFARWLEDAARRSAAA